jgi:hypothetical protein
LSLLARLGLPVDLDARLGPEALAAVAVDKKRAAAGQIRYIALPRPGAPRIELVTRERLAAILEAGREKG